MIIFCLSLLFCYICEFFSWLNQLVIYLSYGISLLELFLEQFINSTGCFPIYYFQLLFLLIPSFCFIWVCIFGFIYLFFAYSVWNLALKINIWTMKRNSRERKRWDYIADRLSLGEEWKVGMGQ